MTPLRLDPRDKRLKREWFCSPPANYCLAAGLRVPGLTTSSGRFDWFRGAVDDPHLSSFRQGRGANPC